MEKAQATKTGSRWFVPLSLAAILAAAILPYVSRWSDPFIADDWVHLASSRYMKTQHIVDNLSFDRDSIYYRPVSIIYFRLNYLAWGLDPRGHHVVKGLFFAATSVLLFAFVCRATGLRAASTIAGLVFALHPLNTSCSVWLSTHGNLLCTFFYLLALWLFIEARRARTARVALYTGFMAAMLLCFGSYELGYTLPVVVLLADFLLLRRKTGPLSGPAGFAPNGVSPGRLKEAWKWHLPYLAVGAAFFLARFLLMGSGYKPLKSPGEVLVNVLPQVAEVLFLPVGRVDAQAPVWLRAIPMLVGLLLFVSLLIFRKDLRRLAIFALVWTVVGVSPAAKIINPAPEFQNIRFLIVTAAGFSMLLGLYFSMFWRRRAGKIAVVLCVPALLGVYTWLDLRLGAKWGESARCSQEIVNVTTNSVRGTPLPFRLVYITYPDIRGVFNTGPSFILSAQIAQGTIKSVPSYLNIGSLYSKTGYEFKLHKPEVFNEIVRWFPLRLDSEDLYECGTFDRKVDVYRISREDLDRTFFFHWREDDKTLVDCTRQMRERLAKKRRAELFNWTAPEKFPYGSVRLLYCFQSPQDDKGIIYLSPLSGSGDLPIVKINFEDTGSVDFDQVEIEMSAASKSYKEGFFTAFVSWRREGEEESLELLLSRVVSFRGRYYEFHEELKKFPHYRVPLAQHFNKIKRGRLVSLYIILPPHVKEIALRSIRLNRFDD